MDREEESFMFLFSELIMLEIHQLCQKCQGRREERVKFWVVCKLAFTDRSGRACHLHGGLYPIERLKLWLASCIVGCTLIYICLKFTDTPTQ